MWLLLFLAFQLAFSADFLQEQINERNHVTDMYQVPKAVIVRRAGVFQIQATVDNVKTTKLILTPSSNLNNAPLRQKGASRIEVPFQERPSSNNDWVAWRVIGDIFFVQIPANAPIGIFNVTFLSSRNILFEPTPLVILCNPWSKNDEVYMSG